ncbi:MAG TPA: adenylate/guanylate cyclase domain-containing protein, partial [Bacillota bacterium]|nr:adenylate/guanylate cyclase domain-containing protein [Bacillota bacterium]
MLSVEEAVIDSITSVFHDLRTGKVPPPIPVPADLPDNEIRQLIAYVNRFLCEFKPFTEAMGQVARGNLEIGPQSGQMAAIQSLKALQSNLRHLTWKTQQIAAGDLEQTVDFMGDFSTAFNTMTRQLKDSYQELERRNQFIRKTFGRYTSDEVVEALLDVPDGLKLGGEEREVSILMSDLRGFTAMAARLTPQEVIGCLNLYLESMVEVITRFQGTIDEIIGDAILVLFGAPIPCEAHAAKAVACGLAMQLALPEVNRRLVEQGAPELEMGIGIHTGRVIVGNIGSERRSKYAAVGSNVNLAGRIESFTTGGQVLISESTREQIKVPLQTLGQFQVEPKGARRSLQLYEVGGLGEPFNLSLPLRSGALHPLPAPLPIRFTVLEEKFLGRTVLEGWLVALSASEAGIQCELSLVALTNLKIELRPVPGANPGGEIYAKVTGPAAGAAGQTRIRFTSLAPELKTWVQQMAARLASAQAKAPEPQ